MYRLESTHHIQYTDRPSIHYACVRMTQRGNERDREKQRERERHLERVAASHQLALLKCIAWAKVYMCIYIYEILGVHDIYICMYIYIYIWQRLGNLSLSLSLCICIYIYLCKCKYIIHSWIPHHIRGVPPRIYYL